MRKYFIIINLLFLCITIFSQQIPVHLKLAFRYYGLNENDANYKFHVTEFLENVNLKYGNAWCAAFVSYVLTKSNVKEPAIKSGLAQKFIIKSALDYKKVLMGEKVPEGSLIIWKRGNTIFGHIGIVVKWERGSGKVIEGNVKEVVNKKRVKGVFIKERKIEPMNYFRITHFTLVKY